MLFLKIKNGKFEVSGKAEVKVFAPTVAGAIGVYNYTKGEHTNMSSDLFHPDEFPDFEEHAIDIAAGEIGDAVEAGVIQALDQDTHYNI